MILLKVMDITYKQNKFSENIALGKTQAEAYRKAYPNSKHYKDTTVWAKASALMKNGKVMARVEELQKETRVKFNITRDTLVGEIIDAQKTDEIKKNGTNVLKAIELKAKITGNLTNRQVQVQQTPEEFWDGVDD